MTHADERVRKVTMLHAGGKLHEFWWPGSDVRAEGSRQGLLVGEGQGTHPAPSHEYACHAPCRRSAVKQCRGSWTHVLRCP